MSLFEPPIGELPRTDAHVFLTQYRAWAMTACNRSRNPATSGRARLTKSSGSKSTRTSSIGLDNGFVFFGVCVFPGATTVQLVEHIKAFTGDTPTNKHQRRMKFMSMCNDIEWWRKDNEATCILNAVTS